MKSHAVVFALTVVLAAAFIALPSSDAQACSPPPEGWSVGFGHQFPQQIPIDGAILFEGYTYDLSTEAAVSHSRIEVTDAGGQPVAGSHGVVVLQEGAPGPPGSGDDLLVHWVPDDDLQPEADYQLSWQQKHPYIDEWSDPVEVSFSTTAESHPTLRPAVLETATADITEQRAGFECCTDDSFCDSCGNCEQCWATRFDYLPTLRTTAEFPADDGITPQLYHEIRVGGEVRDRFWGDISTLDISQRFAEDHDGPLCVTVVSISPAADLGVTSNTECIERSDLPDYTEQTPDEVPPAECDVDAGSGDDAGSDGGTEADTDVDDDAGEEDAGDGDVGAGDVGAGDDAGTNESTASSDGSGCGCAQSGGGVPGGLVGMLIWLGGAMLWRHRDRF